MRNADAGDERFVKSIQSRDPAVMQEVVQSYLAHIYRAARTAFLDVDLAEELTQSTFMTFLETVERFQGRSHIRTWLFGILYNKIAEKRRRMIRDAKSDEISDGTFQLPGHRRLSVSRPVDQQVYQQEVRSAIESCLMKVPARQRMAFILREIEGLETREICTIMEITPSNLGSLVSRARTRLRGCLESKGVEVWRR